MSARLRLEEAISSMPAACSSVAAETFCDSLPMPFAELSTAPMPSMIEFIFSRSSRTRLLTASDAVLTSSTMLKMSENVSPVAVTFSLPVSASRRPSSIEATARSVSS